MQEPDDHALGRSRGGFGTKVHIVCDSRGTIVGIHLTAGQRHESKFFEPTMAQACSTAARGRDAGHGGWPATRGTATRASGAGANDGGSSGDPDAEGPARDENFDKVTYKRRNIVERVIGWFKEFRRLGTRYEKLAVNYVAMWLVAIIEKALFRLLPNRA